ncbi:MAG: DUF4139 domain-containing protein [Bacteroidetes bacterium]|nr:DUF4139 domain-containing protein [Bacteroidota bacterium]
MDLSYKAEIRQQSGMDLKNVALTLSTGNLLKDNQNQNSVRFT